MAYSYRKKPSISLENISGENIAYPMPWNINFTIYEKHNVFAFLKVNADFCYISKYLFYCISEILKYDVETQDKEPVKQRDITFWETSIPSNSTLFLVLDTTS